MVNTLFFDSFLYFVDWIIGGLKIFSDFYPDTLAIDGLVFYAPEYFFAVLFKEPIGNIALWASRNYQGARMTAFDSWLSPYIDCVYFLVFHR